MHDLNRDILELLCTSYIRVTEMTVASGLTCECGLVGERGISCLSGVLLQVMSSHVMFTPLSDVFC